MLPSAGGPHRRRLEDLAVDLTARAHGLAAQLHPNVRAEVGTLVRSMNCYYSNLIEGHNTHPIDIDRALRADYSADAAKRALQLEARAHIEVQTVLDGGPGTAPPPGLEGPATSSAFIQALHREFCRRLPDDLLWVENPDTGDRTHVVPGELRPRHVKIGRHVPVSPGAVPRFLVESIGSSRCRPPTTGCCGSIRSSMATAGSRALCRTRCFGRRGWGRACGRSREGSPGA